VTTDVAMPGWTRPEAGRAALPPAGWLLAVAVAVAFADASIVVLAAPELLAEYDSTVSAVSWVVTGYNVAIVFAAIPVLLLARRRGWLVLTALGLVVFLLASLGCATAGSLSALTWLRVVQGAGAALLLAGSLPLLARLAGSDRAGLAAWSAAAAVGAALGPAAGGVLTEMFSWRSIFYVQAPLAAAALFALPRAARAAPRAADVRAADVRAPDPRAPDPRTAGRVPDPRAPRTAGPTVPAGPRGPWTPGGPASGAAAPPAPRVAPTLVTPAPERAAPARLVAAHVGLALVSAALVGALFLVVLLMINGWGATPLTAAAVATVLPVGTLLSRFATAGRSPRTLAVVGCLTVAGGLGTLALVPGKGWGTAAAALAVTGFGLGLAVPTLTEASIRVGPRLAFDGTLSVIARHVGLVLALAAVTPLLASSLSDRLDHAIVAGTEAGLREPVPLGDKVSLARSLGEALGDTPAGELPDLDKVFDQVAPDGSLEPLQHTLSGIITTAVTGSFRDSFALCALCALLALVPAWRIGSGRPRVTAPRGPTPRGTAPGGTAPMPVPAGPAPRSARLGRAISAVAVVLAPLLAVGLAGSTLRSGGRGTLAVPDPCATQPAFARGGADGRVQQIALDTLDGAACELRTSRAALLLTLLPESGQPQLPLTDDDLTPAVRHGLDHAVDRQKDDGDLPGWTATLLRVAIRVGPVGWLVDQLRGD